MKLGEEDVSRIVDSYEKYKGNSTKASRDLPWAASTIRNYWRQLGFKINQNTDRGEVRHINELSVEEIIQIIKSYDTYHGNSAKAAENLQRSHVTVRKYWRQTGFKINRKGDVGDGRHGGELSTEQVAQIIQAYDTYNGNPIEASKNLLWSSPTIRTYWKRVGFEIPGKGRKTLESKLES
jgi:hypothetical protein